MQPPLLRSSLIACTSLILVLAPTSAAGALAAARPDLQVKLRFQPGKLTNSNSAAESVTFFIDVKNVGSAAFVPEGRPSVQLSTINGSGTVFPKKRFLLGRIKVGQTLTYRYVYNESWPIEHCYAAYVKAIITANDANQRNNVTQITGASVSQAIAALIRPNRLKFGS